MRIVSHLVVNRMQIVIKSCFKISVEILWLLKTSLINKNNKKFHLSQSKTMSFTSGDSQVCPHFWQVKWTYHQSFQVLRTLKLWDKSHTIGKTLIQTKKICRATHRSPYHQHLLLTRQMDQILVLIPAKMNSLTINYMFQWLTKI